MKSATDKIKKITEDANLNKAKFKNDARKEVINETLNSK